MTRGVVPSRVFTSPGGGRSSPCDDRVTEDRACLAFGWVCSVTSWQAPNKTPVCVCVCVCACSSAYFFRPDVFTVQRVFAFCLVAVMGRFVPLLGTAFFWGRTSNPEEEVEEKEDEEEEELLPSSEVAELLLPLDES